MEFQGIALKINTEGIKSGNQSQFYRSLENQQQHRLRDKTKKQHAADVKFLYPRNWLQDANILHGEHEVQALCQRLQLDKIAVVCRFREYKDSHQKAMPDPVKSLVKCVNIIPMASSECEQSFLHMNIIMILL
ncbi:unnamed protein product [Caretta caretta]